jgi:methionine-S-sulfoxide reductase
MRHLVLSAAVLLAACSEAPAQDAETEAELSAETTAVFASGCFWCTEADFEKLPGVLDAVSGYTGGHVENPEYRQVVNGGTGHVEAVRVTFDPGQVSYRQLLDHYWRNVDPFDRGGQFCDRGDSYAPFIFTLDETQAEAAEASRAGVAERFGETVAVRIEPLDVFWPAEDYHQDYAEKNPIRYQRYRFGCRRDQRLRQIWGGEAGGVR